MKYYYVKEERCWADEFDTFCFAVLTEEEFKDIEEKTNHELDLTFIKFDEEEFIRRQKAVQDLKKQQNVKHFYQIEEIPSDIELPYMYGGYGAGKKFDNQYDASYSDYLKRFEGSYNPSFEASFGTNESHEFYSKEDYWNSIDIKEISEEEYNMLIKIIGKYGGLGSFPLP